MKFIQPHTADAHILRRGRYLLAAACALAGAWALWRARWEVLEWLFNPTQLD